MANRNQSERAASQSSDGAAHSASTPSPKVTSAGDSQQQLHKPPILLFLLPLAIIIAYAYFTR
jgi:hypothetical protein